MAGNLKGRVALVIEYDGTNYAGWQYQENAISIQQQIQLGLEGLFKQPLVIRGSSRTDSGVHSRGQVGSIDLPGAFPQEKLAAAINWYLPRDIRIVKAYQVPEDFNPRTWSKTKIYRYYIFNRNQATALGRQYSWQMPKPLNIAAMNQAAAHCLGTHDFASFQAAGSQVEHTIRTIRHLTCHKQGDMVTVTCVGNGFLYNMVRIIVGTLVQVGLGKQPDHLKLALEARKREAAGPTAPANGLFLERVLYRPSLDSYRRL